MLDVGGRKVPNTIALRARVTISDIPREGEVRTKLGFGVTTAFLDELRGQRSNIDTYVIDDMVKSPSPFKRCDVVCCVEVIEHVQEDEAFGPQLNRVLKAGDFLLMTTPNGDYIQNVPPNFNPDHVRDYIRGSLFKLLALQFDPSNVQLTWEMRTEIFRARGLRSLEWRRPRPILETMACNVASHLESRDLEQRPQRRAHLIARVEKTAAS